MNPIHLWSSSSPATPRIMEGIPEGVHFRRRSQSPTAIARARLNSPHEYTLVKTLGHSIPAFFYFPSSSWASNQCWKGRQDARALLSTERGRWAWGGREKEDGAVPESAVEALGRTLSSLQELEAHLGQFLSMAEPDVLSELPPLQRAHVFLVLAKTASALFSVRLRCSGVQLEDHPVRKELERISLHEEKFRQYLDWSRAPLRPSTAINYQAATRFIEHSLPDLTPEQRKGLRDIRRCERVKSRVSEHNGSRKKRKYQTPEKQSVRAAAKDFLEKAARELLIPDNCGLKGPLRNDLPDEEDADLS